MADLTVRFVGDTSKLTSSTRHAEGVLGRFSSKMGGVGRIVAGVFGGTLAVAGARALVHQFGSVISEATEAVKVGKLTNAVLKSTGGIAHVTAKQVSDLADAISLKTGIDDEAIAASENLLLTFTNVRNEVGKGNDIFNRATSIIQDMSVALGQDAKSSAIQLGKALNDPIKGITALRRVGVSFTQSQIDQIKVLVKSGHILDAQKLILKELGTEFGGAAEAAATPMEKLTVVINNLKEKIGLALLPIINKVADWLGKMLPKALDKAQLFFWIAVGAVQAIIRAFQEGVVSSSGFIGWMERVGVAASKVWGFLKEAFEGGQQVITDLADAFGTSEGQILKSIAAITVGLIGLAVAWNAGPGIIVTAVVALAAALLYAYKHFEAFRDGVHSTVNAVRVAIESTVYAVTYLWQRFGSDIVAFAKSAWDFVRLQIQGVLNVIIGTVRFFKALFTGDWSGLWEATKRILSGAWQFIIGFVKGATGIVRFIMAVAWNLVGSETQKAWNGLVTWFGKLPGRFADAMVGLTNLLLAPFRTAFNLVVDAYNNTIGRIPGTPGLSHWDSFSTGGGGGKPRDTSYDVPRPKGPSYAYFAPPGKAMGGFARGLNVVGERGPELADFGSGGANIIPNHKLGGLGGPMVVNLILDGKVLATAVVDQSNRQGGLPIRLRNAS